MRVSSGFVLCIRLFDPHLISERRFAWGPFPCMVSHVVSVWSTHKIHDTGLDGHEHSCTGGHTACMVYNGSYQESTIQLLAVDITLPTPTINLPAPTFICANTS
jgi:hypothetical protein